MFESPRARHVLSVEGGLLDVCFSGLGCFDSARGIRYMRVDSSRLVLALDDPDVARWHANLAERSELTGLTLLHISVHLNNSN
jgi:hypothetical protein